MLTFEKVTKEFKLDETTIIVPVHEVDFNIKPGELIVIVGRSGTGKTTLLNLAAGLVKPTNGLVKIDGVNLAEMTDRQISSLRSRKIGFVFQFPSLFSSLTIKENVTLPTILIKEKRKDINKRAEELLDLLGLIGKINVYPKQLSAGEQKRTIIARSLINRPQLVLADEPTSDLDNHTEAEVMAILRNFNSQGVTFLIVTHSLDLVDLASRAFEMENGSLKQIS